MDDILTRLLLALVLLNLGWALEEFSRNYKFEDLCHFNGGKKEFDIHNGASTLRLNIPHLNTPFQCHLEAEASPGYGIHVYIDEMNLKGDESDGCPEDYLQFGRDVLYFTTFQSPKYCGSRAHVNYSQSDYMFRIGRQTRMYNEVKDSEIDIWLYLTSGSARNITLVITAFKKSCGPRDPYYKRCRHSNHCIHRRLFCDNLPNCAWPEGDVASDEKWCKGSHYIGGSTADMDLAEFGNDYSSANNIPAVVISVIVVAVVLVVAAILLNHFYYSCRQRRSEDESRRATDNRGERTSVLLEPSVPSAPPPYDEVVRNGGIRIIVSPSDDEPPPYSLTIK